MENSFEKVSILEQETFDFLEIMLFFLSNEKVCLNQEIKITITAIFAKANVVFNKSIQ